MNYPCLWFFVFTPVSVILAEPEVTIGLGKIIGKTESAFGKKIYKFLGIPYAIPPVGDLRFLKPLELRKKWNGTLMAHSKPKVCIQSPVFVHPTGIRQIIPLKDMSEDCLYLNIWTPQPAFKNQLFPVIIWIHGGGYITGYANNEDGTKLSLSTKAVVVEINYRLDILGFICGNDSNEMSGNMGLYDQRMAMKWVNKYIRQFNGDRNRVTIFGSSAGSMSITHHLMSKESWPYFQAAFPMSGIGMEYLLVNGKEVALEKAKRLANIVGCSTDVNANQLPSSTIKCLRNKNAFILLFASLIGVNIKKLDVPVLSHIFFPVFPEAFISKAPREIWKRKEIRPNTSILIGNTFYELPIRYLFEKEEKPSEALRKRFAKLPADHNELITSVEFEKLIKVHFTGIDEDKNRDDAIQAASQLATNYIFQCPANEFAKAASRIKSNIVYQLVFNYKSRGSPSTCEAKYPCHADDLLLTFGTVSDQEDVIASNNYLKILEQFVTNGKTFWQPYHRNSDNKLITVYYEFKGDLNMNNTKIGFRCSQCSVWNSMAIK